MDILRLMGWEGEDLGHVEQHVVCLAGAALLLTPGWARLSCVRSKCICVWGLVLWKNPRHMQSGFCKKATA